MSSQARSVHTLSHTWQKAKQLSTDRKDLFLNMKRRLLRESQSNTNLCQGLEAEVLGYMLLVFHRLVLFSSLSTGNSVLDHKQMIMFMTSLCFHYRVLVVRQLAPEVTK